MIELRIDWLGIGDQIKIVNDGANDADYIRTDQTMDVPELILVYDKSCVVVNGPLLEVDKGPRQAQIFKFISCNNY